MFAYFRRQKLFQQQVQLIQSTCLEQENKKETGNAAFSRYAFMHSLFLAEILSEIVPVHTFAMSTHGQFHMNFSTMYWTRDMHSHSLGDEIGFTNKYKESLFRYMQTQRMRRSIHFWLWLTGTETNKKLYFNVIKVAITAAQILSSFPFYLSWARP